MRISDGVRPHQITDEQDDLAELIFHARPAWHADAACKEAPAHVDFFPGPYEPTDAALQVCAGCLVRSECLAWALEHEEADGIWGGLSGRARRRIRPAKPRPARAPAEPKKPRVPAACGTPNGYHRHRRAGENPCPPCREALSVYHRRRRAGTLKSVTP